jgi:SAM-dependent methyltransferase
MRDLTTLPVTDPAPIMGFFRHSYGAELLVAATVHFKLFDHLAGGPLALADLGRRLGLGERATLVLTTALRAMKLLVRGGDGRLALTPLAAEHLVAGGPFAIADYLGLGAAAPGVAAMIERLRSGKPAGAEQPGQGAAYIFRQGIESAMEREASARSLTFALAGRARNCAPVLAARLPLAGVRRVIDVGGGTGLYAIALLQRHPALTAAVWDRPEVLKIARELALEYGVSARLETIPGDMFADAVPAGDAILLSNVLHDWDVAECRALVAKCVAALPAGGRLVVHDALLDDDLGGPLEVAEFSAALFVLTEGRCYSGGEYRGWMEEAGLTVGQPIATMAMSSALVGTRR